VKLPLNISEPVGVDACASGGEVVPSGGTETVGGAGVGVVSTGGLATTGGDDDLPAGGEPGPGAPLGVEPPSVWGLDFFSGRFLVTRAALRSRSVFLVRELEVFAFGLLPPAAATLWRPRERASADGAVRKRRIPTAIAVRTRMGGLGRLAAIFMACLSSAPPSAAIQAAALGQTSA
jgi:hypothetical protein